MTENGFVFDSNESIFDEMDCAEETSKANQICVNDEIESIKAEIETLQSMVKELSSRIDELEKWRSRKRGDEERRNRVRAIASRFFDHADEIGCSDFDGISSQALFERIKYYAYENGVEIERCRGNVGICGKEACKRYGLTNNGSGKLVKNKETLW